MSEKKCLSQLVRVRGNIWKGLVLFHQHLFNILPQKTMQHHQTFTFLKVEPLDFFWHFCFKWFVDQLLKSIIISVLLQTCPPLLLSFVNSLLPTLLYPKKLFSRGRKPSTSWCSSCDQFCQQLHIKYLWCVKYHLSSFSMKVNVLFQKSVFMTHMQTYISTLVSNLIFHPVVTCFISIIQCYLRVSLSAFIKKTY